MPPKPYPMDSPVYKTLDTISQSNNYNTWIFNAIKDHLSGNVLDIGSGLGDIVNYYQYCDLKNVYVSDYSDDMISSLNKKFSSLENHKTVKLNIASESSLNLFPSEHIDTITCINVLEHIQDDSLALTHMKKILKKEGKILLIVPAFQKLYGSLDALVGHFRRYNKKSMKKLLSSLNLSIENQYYMNLFGVFSWFLAGRIFKHNEFDSGACQKLDKLVPFLEKIEKKMKPPLGQSLVVICKKTFA